MIIHNIPTQPLILCQNILIKKWAEIEAAEIEQSHTISAMDKHKEELLHLIKEVEKTEKILGKKESLKKLK